MVCPHKLKKFKLSGILNNSNYEVLICKSCKLDPDLQDFLEITIYKEITQ